MSTATVDPELASVGRGVRGDIRLTQAQLVAVNRFIFGGLLNQAPPPLNTWGMRGLTREQQSDSYQSWIRGGRAWRVLQQGGTGQLAVLCWYQHVHRPGSREWRPSIIIPAFVRAAAAYVAESA